MFTMYCYNCIVTIVFFKDATDSEVFHFTLHLPQIDYKYVSHLDLVFHMSCKPSKQEVEAVLESTYTNLAQCV